MPNYLIPNTAIGSGKLRKKTVQSLSSVSMSASALAQTEVVIPNYGDVAFLEFVLTQSTTGTLTGANTIASALQNLSIKDRSGESIWSNVRGVDLSILDRLLNVGRSRTVATSANSANTHRWIVPCNIEKKDMDARLQVTIAPYSAMATSGATGGSVTLKVVAYYMDETKVPYTQRIARLTQTVASGINRFAPNLPQGKTIQHLMFSVGTESNITDITFSADGNSELEDFEVTDLTAIDDSRLVSGHVTGEFSLYNSPFVVKSKSILDVQASGSDTISWYLVIAE